MLAARLWWPTDTPVDVAGLGAQEIDNPDLGVTFVASGADDLPRQVIVACKQPITVFEAMQRVAAIEPGWRFEHHRSGDLIFINSLTGLACSRDTGFYWVYEVNGKLAQLGVGDMQVGPGDHVLWKFEASE